MGTQVTQALLKALEAGGYNAAPSTLVQGSALQIENLSPVMNNVTYDESHIHLQKMLKVEACKSTLAQFDRQLSYGIFGGSAQKEGAVGQEETSDFVRIVVPMAFYSHIRRVTIVANMVDTVDGVKAEERAATDAAKKLAGDIEFDLFRGKEGFSNAGVFDGSYASIPALPNILGVDPQVRQSDFERNSQDLMFAEYGSDDTVVISGGGTLTQNMIEDASVRSAMNLGYADKLVTDPKVASAYNKIVFGKERIIVANSGAQDVTGGTLRRQYVSGGTVGVEMSRFLSGKTRPAQVRQTSPAAPTTSTLTNHSPSTTSLPAGVYVYYVTSANNQGESSPASVTNSPVTCLAGDYNTISLAVSSGNALYFNVYRSNAGGTAASARWIGRVAAGAGGGVTAVTFTDLNNKLPGWVEGYLVQKDTMTIRELSPYSRLKLAVSDLSLPEAHFRFLTLSMEQPRKDVLIDNLVGSF